MPLFSNKFSPKKTPTRKAFVSLINKDLSPKRIEQELGPDVGPIRLRLGDQEAVFDNGQWIPESGKIGGTYKENERLRKEVKKLEEENNLLRLKFQVMLDMIFLEPSSIPRGVSRGEERDIVEFVVGTVAEAEEVEK